MKSQLKKIVKVIRVLPDKPSELITIALTDLEAAERSKKYKIDMGTFHSHEINNYGEPEKICRVCFAGSVMAFSLGVAQELDAYPGQMDHAADPYVSEKLNFLDTMRYGSFRPSDFRHMEFLTPLLKGKKNRGNTVSNFNAPNYEDDPAGFKRAMRKKATAFRKLGL